MKQLYFCKRSIFHNPDALEFLPLDTEDKCINPGTPEALDLIQYNPTLEIAEGFQHEPPSVILLHEVRERRIYNVDETQFSKLQLF